MKIQSKPYYLFLLSLLSGTLLWAGWPTKPLGFILFFAFVPLLIIEDYLSGSDLKKKGRKFFGYSYLTLLTWNVLTTYWVYNSTAAGGIFAMACNALLMCIPMMLFYYTKKLAGYNIGLISFIAYWITFEFIHLNWELTWPWLTLGNGFASLPQLVQWYEYTGALGGSLWILLSNILIYHIFRKKNPTERIKMSPVIIVLAWMFLLMFYSLYTYNNYEETGEDIEVVVVQPNIDPYEEKFEGSEKFIPYEEQLSRLIALSEKKITKETKYVAWPETALPYGYFEDDIISYPVIRELQNFTRKYPNISLITGLDTYKIYQTQATPSARFHGNGYVDAFNSALQINEKEDLVLYRKSKLVPGVEYMPSFLSSFAIAVGESAGGLGRQKERTVFFNKDSVGVAPVICYESIFGEFVGDYINNGANMIFIITNDGWWGNSQGHKQHLQYAVVRAIETRKDIARSANTGISGFINQRGDIVARSEYWKQDVMSMKIKQNSIKTFYTRNGDYIGNLFSFVSIVSFLAAIVMGLKNRKKKIIIAK
jgi:apolipoprotein N-acyltransferase